MSKKKPTEAKDLYVSGDFIAGDQYINNYYTGDFASLAEYYISPEPVFQRVRTDDFIGRDWLTAKVDAFLNDPQRKSGAFLLIGDAGVGKTSFMAHLVKERRYLHLFAEQAPGQAMLQRAMQSLGSQLVTRYQIDPYKDRDTLNALSVFPDFLERILRLAASTLTEGEKIVIVCDALDEAGTFPDHFVFGLPKELPDGVFLILSQRPVNVKLPNFEPVIEKIEAQGEGNLQDMEAYLSAVAKRPEVAGQIRSKEYSEEFFIQTLKEKSRGVWMYLHYIIKEIESGARAPLDLANLPTGMVGYYAEYWDAWRTGKRGDGKKEWFDLYAPVLATLASSQEPITAEQLTQWAGVAANPEIVEFDLLKDKWRSFLVENKSKNNSTYTIYHLSFRDFISGKVDLDKLDPNYEPLISFLTKATVKAHKRIIDAFEKECNGEWEKLVEQDYPRLHLTSHLNSTGEYEKLRILLTEGDEKIKWAEAREKKEETYTGYLNDLSYVWDYAEREQKLALAIRCMLIENSIHSLASNISPELLYRLARSGVWSFSRCLSIIRQKTDSKVQAQSLKLIALDIPAPLHPEALIAAREIQDEYYRVKALTDLAPCLSDKLSIQVLRESLDTVHKINSGSNRAEILSFLAPILNDDLKVHALNTACEIQDEEHRVKALSSLTPYLSDELKPVMLNVAIKTNNEKRRAEILSALVPYLNDELKAQVLDSIQKIKNIVHRASILSALAPHINDEVKLKILNSTHKMKHEGNKAIILSALAPHLNDELKMRALDFACSIKSEYHRSEAFSVLIPHLKHELNIQVLDAAHMIQDEHSLAKVLIALAPYLNDELKALALQTSRRINNEELNAEILMAFTPHPDKAFLTHVVDTTNYSLSTSTSELNTMMLQESLAAAREIKDSDDRVEALSVLAPFLNDEINSQTLKSAHEIKDEYSRDKVILALTPHLSHNFNAQLLSCACEMQEENRRAEIISILAPRMNSELIARALDAACNIQEEKHRVIALSSLAPHLNDEIIEQALGAAQEINDEELRSKVLLALAPLLRNELNVQTLDTVRMIKNENQRAEALLTLIPYLNNELKVLALEVGLEIKNEELIAKLLSSLSLNLSNELIIHALVAMRDGGRRYIGVISALATHLNVDLSIQVLNFISEIQDEEYRAEILTVIFPNLSNELQMQVLNNVCGMQDEKYRAIALSSLAPYLSDELKTLVFKTAREMKKENRAEVLSGLTPYLKDEIKTQALRETFDGIDKIKDEYHRAKVLLTVTPHLNDELRAQALDTASKIKNEELNAKVLTALIPHLNDELKVRVLNIAYKIKDEKYRVEVLLTLIPNLSNEFNKLILKSVRKLEKEYYRVEILSVLAPYLTNEIKVLALSATYEIQGEEYRAKALVSLAPYFNDELIMQALDAARKIKNEYRRTDALIALTPYLNDELKKQVLLESINSMRNFEDEEIFAEALSNLVPQLSDDLVKLAADVANEMGDENNRIEVLWSLASRLNNQSIEQTTQESTEKQNISLPKNFYAWNFIKFKSLQEIFLHIKLISQKNRSYGLESMSNLIPSAINFSGEHIALELYRTITDVTRWWP